MRLLLVLISAVLIASLTGPALASETTIRMGGAAPADPVVLDTARARVAAGDVSGAIAGLAPYVAQHPQDLAAGRLLGDLYFRIPEYKKAEAIWKAILVIQPDDRETHNRLGSLYAVEDRIDDAIAEFQKSLPSREGYAGLLAAHEKAGDLTPWVARIEATAQADPLDVRAWSTVGQVRRLRHEYERALEAFQHVVALQPRSCDARVDVANALVDLARIDLAMTNLQACLQVDNTYYPAVVNMGEAYLEKNDPGRARPFLERALTLKPQGSEALVDIGFMYDQKGDWKTAVSYYQKATIADPLRPEAYIDLGYDYNEHRLFTLAEAAYLKGLSIAQNDGRLHYMLGVTYNLQGKIDLARAQYQKALQSDEPVVVRAAKSDLALLPPPAKR